MKITTIRDNCISEVYFGEGEDSLDAVHSYMKGQRKLGVAYSKREELEFALNMGFALGVETDTFFSPRNDLIKITY